MSTLKKVLIGLGVIVVVVLGMNFPRGNSVVNQVVGSVTGPDSYFPTETHNGVPSSFTRVGMRSASSTVCSIKSPSVDSRLEHFSAYFNSIPTYATQYMVGSGTMNATTTSIIAVSQISLAAGGTTASSTIASSTTSILIPANTFINLNLSTSTSATVTSTITGQCEAVFMSV